HSVWHPCHAPARLSSHHNAGSGHNAQVEVVSDHRCSTILDHKRSTDVVFVLGTDEAGYGPNLGPLVIGASAWKVPNRLCAERLYELLSSAVAAEPNQENGKLAIADSKRLYKPGMLGLLERGVLTTLTLLERCAGRW